MARLTQGDPVWFRLQENVRWPLDVVFPTAHFRLELTQETQGSWFWSLRASEVGTAKVVVISEAFKEAEWLRQALYRDGFATRHATVGETILLRMVKTGLAEKLDKPLRQPEPQRGMPWNWL